MVCLRLKKRSGHILSDITMFKNMKNKKKIIIRAVIIFLVAALLISGLAGGYVLYRMNGNKSGVNSEIYEKVYENKEIKLSVDSSGIFKILKINDTHLFDGKCENDTKTLGDIKSVLDKMSFDLIVADGDIVDGFNLKPGYDKFGALDKFASLIEEYDTPWAFAPGNNDCEIDGSNEDIIAFLIKYEHFLCGNERDIYGSVHFFVDLYSGENLVHSVAVMDSGTRQPHVFGDYEPMKESQALWLSRETDKRKVKTSVFFHMPTNAFQKAYDKGESVTSIERHQMFPYAEKSRDGVFDNIISENKFITLISCAHQHSNNMCSFYNGRYYQLSSLGGYGAVGSGNMTPSFTVTTIDTKADKTEELYNFEQVRPGEQIKKIV